MWKKTTIFLFCIAVMFSLNGCATSSKLPDLTKKGGYTSIYVHMENRIDKRLNIEPKRPPLRHPEYMRVWRGSYADNRGNFIEDGWEWILVRPGGPDANF